MTRRFLRLSSSRCLAGFSVAAILSLSPVQASPWAEVGSAQLRSDINLLASAGLIDNITTQWPLPWRSILARLDASGASDSAQPAYLRLAIQRVRAAGQSQTGKGEVRYGAYADAASNPSPVRGFDGMGREKYQGAVSAEIMDGDTSVKLSIGAQRRDATGKAQLVLDDSYIAQNVGNAVVYAGYKTHWWGPGWISALSLSNNARPMPQIGIARLDTSAFETPWLSWLGPWQAEFFVGWLDDRRVAKDTIYNGLRVTLNPLPGLEIGFARTQQICGRGHGCSPFESYFDLDNNPANPNASNDEGVFDIRYTNMLGSLPFEAYMQAMNEDSSPFTHSGTSHLFGASAWIPAGDSAIRLTLEYANSVATANLFDFGNSIAGSGTNFHGAAYNNATYPDGMRYRGRTLGFSLDSDSRLLSVQASWADKREWTYTLSFHHADISTLSNPFGNVVTASPVAFDIGEARVSIPWKGVSFDLAARYQGDQPRPNRGSIAAIEAAIRFTQ